MIEETLPTTPKKHLKVNFEQNGPSLTPYNQHMKMGLDCIPNH